MFDDVEIVEETKPAKAKGGKGKVAQPADPTTQLLELVASLQAEVVALKSQVQTQTTQPALAPVVQDMSVVRALQNQQVQERFRGFNHHMVNAERTVIRIPQAYKRFFGNFMVSGVNGNTVSVPIDGREHEVSIYHYDDILNKMARVDELYARQGSDVIQEDSPGTI